MKLKSIYVAASSQHVGKTTSTLGLVSAFISRGYRVGYCKPVGQQALKIEGNDVDKDTVLFADLIDFAINPSVHSPVILGSGATTAYLDNPEGFDYATKVIEASASLEKDNDLVIYEGTGHPGVGSVVGLSNARIASMVKAGVVFVVEGGIGSSIDQLNMNLALFREESVPILGVIVNKVIPDKMAKVSYYIQKWLAMHQIPLLGVLPYDEGLAYPQMYSIADAINGNVLYNADHLDNKVESFLAGSLIEPQVIREKNNLLLVVSTPKVDEAINTIRYLVKRFRLDTVPLAGVVATGPGEFEESTVEFIKKNKIPFLTTHLDTYGSVIKISRIEVKINRDTPGKIIRAIELIRDGVDINVLQNKLLPPS
jgi:BioD-like phosphotransacetylase family protein